MTTENRIQGTRMRKRGLLGGMGLLPLGGCAAAVGGGAAVALLAVLAGYFLGEINVQFSSSPEEDVLSDGSGDVRMKFDENGTLAQY